MNFGWKLCPLERTQGFSKIWPSDLVFDPTWPSFELGLDFIKTNILTKFHKDWIETVPARVYTSKSWRDGRTTDDGHQGIPKAHPEHFVLANYYSGWQTTTLDGKLLLWMANYYSVTCQCHKSNSGESGHKKETYSCTNLVLNNVILKSHCAKSLFTNYLSRNGVWPIQCATLLLILGKTKTEEIFMKINHPWLTMYIQGLLRNKKELLQNEKES